MDLTKILNEEQAKAANYINGPSLIIAGAGSGKTRMITYRIANMLDYGIKSENILALTFTNKAAKEMNERINQVMGKDIKKLTCTTFHSFGLIILKQYIHHLGYHNDFTIYDQNDNISLLKQSATNLNLDTEALNLRLLLESFSNFKTGRMELPEKDSEVYKLYQEWTLSQKAYNVVDFDDLIVLPIKLFKTKSFILSQVQEKYKYILVDEFQDTSLIQYELIRLIAEKERNICVVGDDDQSIYSWRGANYKNIEYFERDFPERKEFKLERNYRSSGNILKTANMIIKNNSNRKDKTLWTSGNEGSLIFLENHEDSQQEILEIATSIKRDIRINKLNYSDFAILVRTNSQIKDIENIFIEKDIPYSISGGSSFFDRKEIRDILCYLKTIINPYDDASLLRIINVPSRGVGRITVEKLRADADKKNISLQEELSEAFDIEGLRSQAKESIQNFNALLTKWKKEVNNPTALINSIIKDTYYIEMLHQEAVSENAFNYKLRGLTYLNESIKNYLKRNPDGNLRDYLNAVSLISDNKDENENKVNIQTIHASKGLEFKVVHISGADSSHIPSEKALEENPKNIEEERRLFYVAITRAKEKLVIHYSNKIINYKGEEKEVGPSVFIKEIDNSLVTDKEIAPEVAKAEGLKSMNELLQKMKANLGRK